MDYLAIARKWRPSRFEDLVGQPHVVQTLRNAIALGRVTHSYLFSGARGVGKTSVARIFAKALRCPNVQGAVPCNQCEECQLIGESRSIDVIEIDGASNNGVESVRGIRENVAYSPATGKYKIYIIDEVHMLSISAFNALLKTLEEPPPHVIFLFATTEAQKIPLTILSRCQRFEFRRLTQSQIVERLKTILQAEGARISDDGLRLIASHSDGALRDALSLLDQALSHAGALGDREIGAKEVACALGVQEAGAPMDYLAAVLAPDLKAALTLVGEIDDSGADLKHFTETCLREVRRLYLLVLSREDGPAITAEELDVSPAQHERLVAMAAAAELVRIERMAQILAKSAAQLGASPLPRFVLEMATVRMARLRDLARFEASLRGEAEPAETEGEIPAETAERIEPEAELEPEIAPQPVASAAPPPRDSQSTWKAFVEAMMRKRPLLGALLSHAGFRVETGESGTEIVLVFPEGSFYDRQAADPKNRRDIEELAMGHFGPGSRIRFGSEKSDGGLKSLEAAQQTEIAAIRREALADPGVLKLKESLGADVVDVNVSLEG